VTFGLAYTWSKVMDTADTDFAATNPFNTRLNDYGVASFDRTHILAVNYVISLPNAGKWMGASRIARAIGDNWQVSGITNYSSGTPTALNLAVTGQNLGQRVLGTPAIVPGAYRYGDAPGPSGGLYINPNAYYMPNIGDIGPYPNGYLRNPGYCNNDVSVFKNIRFHEKWRLQLRVEAFNVLNHTEFTTLNVGAQVATSTGGTGNAVFNNWPTVQISNNLRPAGSSLPLGQYFGEPNNARTARVIQLAAKLYF
jgi:hypothetical protein